VIYSRAMISCSYSPAAQVESRTCTKAPPSAVTDWSLQLFSMLQHRKHSQQSSELVVIATPTSVPFSRYRVTRSVFCALRPSPHLVQLAACAAGSQSGLNSPSGQGLVVPLAVK
jgi:hypothetical protein